MKPLQFEVIPDPCQAVNPETGGYCGNRQRGHAGPHHHDVWEYDPDAGENVITGFTEWGGAVPAGDWAEISPCGTWRYGLGRGWDPALPVLGWIMLNPSTADAKINDQTIRRVMTISRAAGYGAAWVANLFALPSPSPA